MASKFLPSSSASSLAPESTLLLPPPSLPLGSGTSPPALLPSSFRAHPHSALYHPLEMRAHSPALSPFWVFQNTEGKAQTSQGSNGSFPAREHVHVAPCTVLQAPPRENGRATLDLSAGPRAPRPRDAGGKGAGLPLAQKADLEPAAVL